MKRYLLWLALMATAGIGTTLCLRQFTIAMDGRRYFAAGLWVAACAAYNASLLWGTGVVLAYAHSLSP